MHLKILAQTFWFCVRQINPGSLILFLSILYYIELSMKTKIHSQKLVVVLLLIFIICKGELYHVIIVWTGLAWYH